MSMKPKTGRRLLLIGVSAAVLLAATGGVFGVRRWQMQRVTQEFRTDALALYEKKEYYDALGKFAGYLKRLKEQNDIPAMLAYAECREMVEEPDATHIRQAIDWYRKAWSLNTADTKTGLKLLDLYVAINMNTEARDLAVRMRPGAIGAAGKEHFEILQREVAARSVLAPKDEINGQILKRMLEIKPKDFPTMVLYAEWSRQQQGRSVAVKFAEERARDKEAGLTTGQSKLLMATARRMEPGFDWQTATFEALCEVTGLDPVSAGPVGEAVFPGEIDVLRAATLFDSLNAFGHSLAVLTAGHKQFNDPTIERSLARRLWMSGRGAEIEKLFPEADLTAAGTHSEVLIYRALALHDAGKTAEAQKIADSLAQRKGDFRVVAWTPAFKALFTTPPLSDGEKYQLFELAVEKSRFDPVLKVYLGDSLEALGRYSEARKHWDDATRSSLAVGWMQPWLRRTYALLNEGRIRTAYESASVAMRYSPRSMAAYVALFRAQTAMVRDGFVVGVPTDQLLGQVDRLDRELALDTTRDAKLFREIVLPGRVLLTSRVRDKASARTLLNTSLAENPDLSQDTLSVLLDISTLEDLGKSEEILARLEKVGGMSLSAVFPRAVTMLNQGKKDEGLAHLEKFAAEANESSKGQWQRAIARYLDAAQDPTAKERWAVMTDSAPTDLSAVLAALESDSVLKDKPLVERLIKRAIELGKYDATALPSQLRLAQAQSLLADPVTNATRAQAVDILQTLTKTEPDWVEPRMLLVQAHAMEKPEFGIKPDPGAAIKELRDLITYAPDPAPLSVQLARLYRVSGDFANAKAELERVANTPTADASLRLEAADMLMSQREMAAAETALEQLQMDEERMRTPDVDARLANIYRSLRNDGQLQQVLRRLLDAKLTKLDHVFITADGFAYLKDDASAKKALEKLSQMTLKPGELETVNARFEARNGDKDKAVVLLQQAIELAPENEAFWQNLLNQLVDTEQFDEAAKVLADGRKRFPSSRQFANLNDQLDMIRSGKAQALDLEVMAKNLDANPGADVKARAGAIRRIDQLRKEGRLADINVIRELMANFDGDAGLVQTLATVVLQLTPPRPDLAADVLRSGLAKHPADAAIAEQAVRIFAGVGAFGDMERAAVQWRDLVRTPAADLAVIEAMVLGKRYANALEEMRSLVKRAEADPADGYSVRVLSLQGEALCRLDRAPEAFEKLSPLLERSPGLRTSFWLPAAADLVQQEASARAWIERVRPLLDRSSETDVIALASAYAGVGRRFDTMRVAMFEQAQKTLASFVEQKGESSPRVLECLGFVYQGLGKNADAGVAYRQAIEKQPKSIFALRGLAELSLADKPAEALTFARRAVEIGGDRDTQSKSLLGTALLTTSARKRDANDVAGAVSDANEAVGIFDSLLAGQPGNAMVMMQAIAALDAADRQKETVPRYEELTKLPRASLPAGITGPMLLNNLAYALLRTGATGPELVRAQGLAKQATEQLPSAATFDTLGQIELARNDKKGAISAFRTAIERDGKSYSSMVGLAEAYLMSPSPQDETEARRLLDELDKKGAAVPTALQDQVAGLRRRLP